MVVKISEARYNDLVYASLKKLYFEPIFGHGGCPRGCDIRVCMQMGCQNMLLNAGPAAMILRPDEVPPNSHTILLEVDTDTVFKEIVNYMEDHWLKQTTEEAFGCELAKKEMKEYFETQIIPCIMGVPEEQCGPQEEKKE
jgi:hypothetical protein